MQSDEYSSSQKKLRTACYLAGVLLVAVLVAAYSMPPQHQYPQASRQPDPMQQDLATLRIISGEDPLSVGLTVSQTIYPATAGSARPNAVVLVPDDDWHAAVGAARLSAHPVDGPIIPIPSGPLPASALREIKRLNPPGMSRDGGVQVLLCGDFPSGVPRTLQDEGFRVRWLNATSPEELLEKIDHYLSVLRGDHLSEVLIIPIDEPHLAAIAAFWAARTGQTVLFSHRNSLPEATKRALDLRPRGAFSYVMAPAEAIGHQAVQNLANYGHVQRVPGEDAFSLSVAFARYSDTGDQLRWWLDATPKMMGWGASAPGYGPVFADAEYPMHAMAAAGLANRAGAGPLLWFHGESIPQGTLSLLQQIQPSPTSHLSSRFNRGWVVGGGEDVSAELTGQIEMLLRKKEGHYE